MSTNISALRKKYRCIEKNIGASKKISVHWENIVVHWENIVVHWENIVVHWENIVVHWENTLLCTEKILLCTEKILLCTEKILLCTEKYCYALRKYCCVLRNVFVHWENIVVYCNIFTCMHKYCCVLHIWATVEDCANSTQDCKCYEALPISHQEYNSQYAPVVAVLVYITLKIFINLCCCQYHLYF